MAYYRQLGRWAVVSAWEGWDGTRGYAVRLLCVRGWPQLTLLVQRGAGWAIKS